MQFTIRGLLLLLAVVATGLSFHDRLADRAVIVKTDRELDVAIVGDGFFCLSHWPNGDRYYTRDGNFRVNSNGSIEWAGDDSRTLLLEPCIQIPSGVERVIVSSDGRVQVEQPGSSITSQVGQLYVCRFIDPDRLAERGPGALFEETDASSTPTSSNPGLYGAGYLQQRWREHRESAYTFLAKLFIPASILLTCAFIAGMTTSEFWTRLAGEKQANLSETRP